MQEYTSKEALIEEIEKTSAQFILEFDMRTFTPPMARRAFEN